MLDIIVLAIQCNVAPAITYLMDAEFSHQDYSAIGVKNTFHSVTHHTDADTGMIADHRKINGHYAKKFTQTVQKIAALKDLEGQSALNSMIISLSSGMSDSNAHDRTKGIPMVWAGGSALGVPQGKLLSKAVSMSQVWRTMMSYTSIPSSRIESFGKDQGGGDLLGDLKAL